MDSTKHHITRFGISRGRQHPRSTVRIVTAIGRHPRRAAQAATLAKQAQRIVQDDDVQHRVAATGLRLMNGEGTFQHDVAELAKKVAHAYQRDQRRARRRNRMRAAALMAMLGAGAYAGTRAAKSAG